MIKFTKHALEKFEILARHGFRVSKSEAMDAIVHPEIVDYSRRPLKIAQRAFDKTHVLRVVYREENDVKVIANFYPGRQTQYEKR